jgi:hypothetical protein
LHDQQGIKFAVRGDSLLQTRHEGSKNTKKYRNFKPDFESEFWTAFGESTVDHTVNVGQAVRDVTLTISIGSKYDIMVVAIGIQDLIDQSSWQVVANYPPNLDNELEQLARAMLEKSPPNGSLVLCGGPARFWNRPPRWDTFMARARNTLRRAGVQVVPAEIADEVFLNKLHLSSDGHHILNMDNEKEIFAKSWASWLLAAGADPNFGRAITDEPVEQPVFSVPEVWPELNLNMVGMAGAGLHMAGMAGASRGRSRSPPRQQGWKGGGFMGMPGWQGKGF